MNIKKMIELKKEFEKKGVQYTQVFKNEAVCLYRLAKTYDDGVTSQWFEIFRRRTRPADRFHSDEWEWYPCDEAFGDWAWCCSNTEVVDKVLNREFPDENCDEILSHCHTV